MDDLTARDRSEHLAGRCLVDAPIRAVVADRVEHMDDDVRVRLPRRLRIAKRRGNAALAGEVVDLLGADVADQRPNRSGVAKVAPHGTDAWIVAERRLRRRDVTYGGVDRPAVGEQPVDEGPAILSGSAGDDRRARLHLATHGPESRRMGR